MGHHRWFIARVRPQKAENQIWEVHGKLRKEKMGFDSSWEMSSLFAISQIARCSGSHIPTCTTHGFPRWPLMVIQVHVVRASQALASLASPSPHLPKAGIPGIVNPRSQAELAGHLWGHRRQLGGSGKKLGSKLFPSTCTWEPSWLTKEKLSKS